MFEVILKFKSTWEPPKFGYRLTKENSLVRRTHVIIDLATGKDEGYEFKGSIVRNIGDIDDPILAQKLLIEKVTCKMDMVYRVPVWMAFARHSHASFKIMGSPQTIHGFPVRIQSMDNIE